MTYFGTRLSENISRREPEGYLICLNVPVARTGVQDYLPSELGLPGPDDRLIPVRREASEVFSPACMASFEGMPVTDDHPSEPEGVTVENSRYLEKGHVQNVRRGAPPEEDLLLADLIIKDPRLIDKILSGKREISCGYNYVLSAEDGTYFQREIRGNHVAVVDSGRAGPRVSIRDQKGSLCAGSASGSDRSSSFSPSPSFSHTHPTSGGNTAGTDNERSTQMNRKNHWRAKLMARMARDGDVESLAEMITELMETPDPSMTAPAVPAGPAIAAPAAQPLQAGSAMDPVVAAVVQAVEGPMEAAPVVATPAAAPVTVAPEAPVEVSTPADQPVLVDCGPEILAALNRIIELLTASHGADCNDPARQMDAEPIAEEASEPAASETAETAEAVEAAAEVAEVTEAVIGALGMEAEASTEGDPVEELVAEILETGDPAPASPVEEAVQEEILSAVLEPDAAEDAETGENTEAAENPDDDPETAEDSV